MPLKQVATSGEKKREREKERGMTEVGFIRTGFRDLLVAAHVLLSQLVSGS